MERASKNVLFRLLMLIACVTCMGYIWTRPSAVKLFPEQALTQQPAADPAAPAQESSAPVLGDLNKDGVLDAADVLALQNIYIMGTTDLTEEEKLSIADINADGIVDTSDSALLTAYLADNNVDHSSVSLRDYAGRYAG